MKAALLLLVGCAGVHGSLATAHDAVRDDYCRSGWCKDGAPRVEYLGEGCYLVDDGHLYGCTTDALPVGERTCMWMPQGETTVTYESCSFELTGPSTCRTLEPPRHCFARAAQHDRRHGRGCEIRVRQVGAVSRASWMAIDQPTMRDVVEVVRSGKRLVQIAATACPGNEAHLVRSSGFARLDALALSVVRMQSVDACADATVLIDNWDSCL